MTIVGSVYVMTVGAIVDFAVNVRVAHLDIDLIGIFLMVVGAAGLIFGLVQQGIWPRREREAPIDDGHPPPPPPS